MPVTDRTGPWHTLTITEDDGERDHTVVCPPNCTTPCALDDHLEWYDFETFNVPEPDLPVGTHHIRLRARLHHVPAYDLTTWIHTIDVEPAAPS